MAHHLCSRSAGALCVALAALVMPAWAMHPGDGYTWGDAPPALSKGAKLAVLQGDPAKPEPYTVRLALPANYRIAPHFHTQAESVTVISGMLMVGMGDKFDTQDMKTLKPGGFKSIAGSVHHYAMTKGATEIQIHGVGPFDITYINPADDPQKGAAAK